MQTQVAANTMAVELVNQALQAAEAELERLVTERTAELSRMNLHLQQEIQRHQQTEVNLRHSQRDLKDFVENAIVALHRLDVNGTILWANQAELDMLGYSREEFIGHSILEFHVNPGIVPEIMACLLNHQPVRAYEVQFRCKDGSIRHVLLDSSACWRDGEFSHTRCFMRDVSERKQAEIALQEMSTALSHAVEGISRLDLQGRYTFVNEAYAGMVGYTTTEMLGMDWQDMVHADDLESAMAAYQQMRQTGKVEVEARGIRKDGSVFNKQIVMISAYDQQQEFTGHYCLMKDITEKKRLEAERKQLEAQFLRAQRLESLGTLASGIAHDMNNVLTPILAASQLLPLKLTNLDENTHVLLSMLEESAKRGSNLVKQILSFARGSDGTRSSMQLLHVLNEVVKITRQTFPKSIEIVTHFPTDIWCIAADATQLHQVLMNLVINARDAMPDGGTLTVSVENITLNENYAQLHVDAQAASYVVVTITDTGMGMSPAIMERVFEPFFTTKDQGQGTGLGLSTTLGIIKSHGGFINPYSDVGRGTCFKIYIPAEESTASMNVMGNLDLPLGDGELVLVVDDEVSVREITKASLETHNYQVITASDGIEAIAIYAKHQADIQFILLDMMMPALDSISTIRTLQRINPHLPIVAMSGLSSNAPTQSMSEGDVQAFLAKPFTSQDLLQTLYRLKNADRST